MIPRYSRPEMTAIWSEHNKLQIFLKVETAVCEAASELGIAPQHVSEIVKEFGDFDIERINQIEAETKHDVIAFLTNVSEFIIKNSEKSEHKKFDAYQIKDALRYLHYGMTSSDLLDTTLAYQLKQSSEIIINKLEDVLSKLLDLAEKYKYQACIGRSHGVHAEPISFGQKILYFHQEFKRSLARLHEAKKEISTCMISGPVGNFAVLSPRVEEIVASKLGLRPEICSTQVINRDRHAYFFSILGILASSIEHFATEIRHLQRSEVLEVEEGFSSKQKGSSAMPHKKNPILSENLTGLARMIRSYVVPTMENVSLLHERDISHSSVERIMTPDACILTDFALHRLNDLITNLVIRTDNMEKNMQLLGDMYRSHVSLLSLIELGLSRDESYLIIQRNSMSVWKKEKNSLIEAMKNDTELLDIIKSCNDSQFFDRIENFDYLKYVDEVFEKISQANNQVWTS